MGTTYFGLQNYPGGDWEDNARNGTVTGRQQLQRSSGPPCRGDPDLGERVNSPQAKASKKPDLVPKVSSRNPDMVFRLRLTPTWPLSPCPTRQGSRPSPPPCARRVKNS